MYDERWSLSDKTTEDRPPNISGDNQILTTDLELLAFQFHSILVLDRFDHSADVGKLHKATVLPSQKHVLQYTKQTEVSGVSFKEKKNK